MSRTQRLSCLLAAIVGFGWSMLFAAEQPKMPAVGMAIPIDAATNVSLEHAFEAGLRDQGWIDGQNIRLIKRYANSDPVKYREQIRELIALNVDVLWGEAAALREATSTIPVVSATMSDPVGTGLAQSLAHPGGNVTGMVWGQDADPKYTELIKELLPHVTRVHVMYDPVRTDYDETAYLKGKGAQLARQAGGTLRLLPVGTLDDIKAAVKTVRRERAQALVVVQSPLTHQYRDVIMRPLAHRIPIFTPQRHWVLAGAIASFGSDPFDLFRRSAGHVDKILKGAKPGDLPIEQPTKFLLVINLKAAKKLGIKVAESILAGADEVIR